MGRQVEASGLPAFSSGERMTMSVIETASATAVVIAIAIAAIIIPLPRPKPEMPPVPPAVEETVTEPQTVPLPPPPPVPHLEAPDHVEDVRRVKVIQLQVEEAKRDVMEIAKVLRSKKGPEDARR